MNYLWIAPIAATLYWLYLKIRALFLNSKAAQQSEALKELKNDAITKTHDADNSYEHTKQLYDAYKAPKPGDGNNS